MLCSTAAVAKQHPPGAAWVPVAAADPRLTVEGERATFKEEGLSLQVERLDLERRALFLSSAGLGDQDPFASQVLEGPVLTFLVRVENTGDEPLEMRPQNFFLITRRPVGHVTPCDFTCLIAIGERAGFDDRGRRKLLAAALDASETVRPGGRISKLLVFTRMPESFREFILDFDMISVGSHQVRFVLPFTVEEMDKKSGGG